jgi:glycogen debranching enzyme
VLLHLLCLQIDTTDICSVPDPHSLGRVSQCSMGSMYDPVLHVLLTQPCHGATSLCRQDDGQKQLLIHPNASKPLFCWCCGCVQETSSGKIDHQMSPSLLTVLGLIHEHTAYGGVWPRPIALVVMGYQGQFPSVGTHTCHMLCRQAYGDQLYNTGDHTTAFLYKIGRVSNKLQ